MTFFLVLFLVVLFGSFLQRVSGMGLGLVAGSVMAILLGPVEGIMVVNVLALINAAIMTVGARRHIDGKILAAVAPMLLVGAIPAALLITVVSVGWMQIIVGALLLLALTIVVVGNTNMEPARGRLPALIAGTAAGFMNTLAGVAGPAMAVYAQAIKWEQQAFAATMQPIFVVAALWSLLTKFLLGSGSLSGIDPWLWPVGVAAMVIGILMGARYGEKIPRDTARVIALSLAGLGGVMAIARGVMVL